LLLFDFGRIKNRSSLFI